MENKVPINENGNESKENLALPKVKLKIGERSVKFFAYHWDFEDVDIEGGGEINVIHIYGITKENKNVFIKVHDFSTYCYIELPTVVEGEIFKWDEMKARSLLDKLNNGPKRPRTMCFVNNKKKLY